MRLKALDRIEDAFVNWEPRRRRRFAVHLLIWSAVLGHTNVGVFLAGLISHETMDTITNYLSWLALTVTCADILVGTDVREQEDSG